MKSQDDTGGDRRRLSKTELMIILVIIFILAGIAVPNFMEASLRSKVSKRDASMRNFATALESYYVDHKSYPPMRPLKDFVRDKSWLKKSGGENLSAASPWLTTPVSYLGAFPSDPFTSSREPAPFAYYSDGLNGWICFSPGPDLDYDIINPGAVYDPNAAAPSAALFALTYDPTNGSDSNGDVYRFKQ